MSLFGTSSLAPKCIVNVYNGIANTKNKCKTKCIQWIISKSRRLFYKHYIVYNTIVRQRGCVANNASFNKRS